MIFLLYNIVSMPSERKKFPIGQHTEEVFGKAGKKLMTEPNTVGKKNKYARSRSKQLKAFREGHDLLQYNIVVRPYIKRRFKIEKDIELDILLYLYPIQYFTVKDYNFLPMRESGYTVPVMTEKGYLKTFINPTGAAKILTLTDFAIKIVRAYYEYLSGEKTISGQANYTNPYLGTEANKIDKQRHKVMEKLKRQTKTQPSKFRRDLFL